MEVSIDTKRVNRKMVPRYKRQEAQPDMRTSIDIRVPRYRHILKVLYDFDEYLIAEEIQHLIPADTGNQKRHCAIRQAQQERINRGQIQAGDPKQKPKVRREILQALQKLYHSGYVNRRSMGLQKAPLYVLDQRAIDILHEDHGIDHEELIRMIARHGIKDFALDHARLVRQFHVALHRATHSLHLTLTWHHERWLRELLRVPNAGIREKNKERMMGSQQPVYPIADAYFTIENGQDLQHFYLECDRSTMQRDRFVGKAHGYYQLWLKSRKDEKSVYETLFGAQHFRVLTTTISAARWDNLLEIIPREDSRIWSQRHNFSFVHQAAYQNDPAKLFSQIWKSAPKKEETHYFPGLESVTPSLF